MPWSETTITRTSRVITIGDEDRHMIDGTTAADEHRSWCDPDLCEAIRDADGLCAVHLSPPIDRYGVAVQLRQSVTVNPAGEVLDDGVRVRLMGAADEGVPVGRLDDVMSTAAQLRAAAISAP